MAAARLTTNEGMKTCTKCGESKPIEAFSKDGRASDGRRSECRVCKSSREAVYRAANRDKRIALSAAWYAANKERTKANRTVWAAANKEKVKLYSVVNSARWYAKNKDISLARAAIQYTENREKRKAQVNEWRASNPEAMRIIGQNRRARKRAAGGRLTTGLAERLFKLQRGKCACCGKSLSNEYHLDHIMPLALGGLNVDSNIQLLCPSCNLTKGAKHPVEFMQTRGFLL